MPMSERATLAPQTKDLGGGLVVHRLLPSARGQAVGPFVFFDHFGPLALPPGAEHDVRPHPHVGLATVTYLLDGAMLHRDSTGAVQRIGPGAINGMTAGRGIVHCERTPDDLCGLARRLHGLQLGAALPVADEDAAPVVTHTPAAAIPSLEVGGATLRVLVGEAFGAVSPVATHSPTPVLDIALEPGDAFPLPPAAERAVYGIDGALRLDGESVPPHTMVTVTAGDEPMIATDAPARVVLIGGEPLGDRHLWWNFVASRRERLVQAADDWAAGRLPAVPGETEFIPLPERRPTA